MLGNNVVIRRMEGCDLSGTLQRQDATGVVVTIAAWGEQATNVFVPMGNIREIEDQGPVYR